eukprot:scaffold6938_cov108-Cylindrotheca_fusiformis.AAC.3
MLVGQRYMLIASSTKRSLLSSDSNVCFLSNLGRNIIVASPSQRKNENTIQVRSQDSLTMPSTVFKHHVCGKARYVLRALPTEGGIDKGSMWSRRGWNDEVQHGLDPQRVEFASTKK